jgi:hypothetical protein
MIEEKEHTPKEEEIELLKKAYSQKVVGDVINEPSRSIDVEGKVLVLSRRNGFLEIDVTGERYIPTLFKYDVDVSFKDPIQRDVAYIQEKYPDAYGLLLKELKRRIQYSVAKNEKKMSNLSRIIEYINKVEGRIEPDRGMKVFLTPLGTLSALGEVNLRMKETGKSYKEVLEDNEKEIQAKMERQGENA